MMNATPTMPSTAPNYFLQRQGLIGQQQTGDNSAKHCRCAV